MKPAFLCALLLLSTSLACADSGNKIFITSTSKTNQPAKPGEASGEAAAIARQMEVFTAIALSNQFPCSSSLTSDDIGALLSLERQRELLGNPSPENFAAIGQSMGAKYLIDYQVTQIGSQVTVTGSAINSANGRSLSRKTVTLPGGDGMVDAMEAFAKSFASSMGPAGPNCHGGWQGTVTVDSSGGSSAPTPEGHDTLNGTSSLHLDCQVKESIGYCTVTFGSSMEAKDMKYSSQASGKVETPVSVDLVNGKTTIKISMVTVRGTRTTVIAGIGGGGDDDFQFGGWSAEGPGKTGGSDSLSGSWSDGAGTTIAWNLSMS
jgi:hypothetical protein